MDKDFFYGAHTMDGAFGTLAIRRGNLHAGVSSETLNLTMPRLVQDIHAAYAAAGADIICANTFGANPLKCAAFSEVIPAAIRLARAAAPDACIALDVGSCGKVIGEGGVTFDDAVRAYERYYSACGEYDCIMIETMTDLRELRAALIAAKRFDKPAICSMSFEENGRTFFGCTLESFAVCAAALGARAVGINCSLGAVKIKPLAKRLREISPLPVYVKPNAGMPVLTDGGTAYDETADVFAAAMEEVASYGIAILGGCCGTDENYIRRLADIPRTCVTGESAAGKLCSELSTVQTGAATLTVGERINPTGKPLLKQALRDGDLDYVTALALEQAEQGADILDVNLGLNDIDENETMRRAVDKLKSVGLPLVIDTSSAQVLESALKAYDGKALVNSVNGTEESLCAVLPLAAKYGAAIIGLCIDENGIPPLAEQRVAVAKKIIARAAAYGMDKKDIYIDTLTMAEGSGRGNALAAVNALKAVKALGVNTVLGISNISFGMPDREDVNAAFYEMCSAAGLTLAIINPKLRGCKGSAAAHAFLRGDAGAADRYIAAKAGAEQKTQPAAQAGQTDLKTAVIRGLARAASEACETLLQREPPMDVAAKYIVPALDEVGARYESGTFFLPQLIAAADAAKAALNCVTAALPEQEARQKKRFVLCTVKGDVHDIGKNIVKAVVSNYGYQVVDLGRDVCEEKVLEAVRKHYPCVLGLSALMTTTAVNMAQTIQYVRREFPNLQILVGGAVLTEEYAKKIGGLYCRDANETVKRLQSCRFEE